MVCSTLALLLSAYAVSVVGPRASAHTPHDSIADIAVSRSFADDQTVFVIAANRLLRSTDGGFRWEPLVRGLPRPPEEGKSLAKLSISRRDPDVMYVSSRVGGVFRSADGGESWQTAAGGLVAPDVTPLAVSPGSDDVVLAGGSVTGLFRTTNGGERWAAVEGFDRVPAIGFVAGTGRAVVGDAAGRVSVSNDDGSTWQEVARSSNGHISAIAASEEAAGATVFAGTGEGELLRSEDGGDSFTAVGTGLPNEAINSIVLSPDFPDDGVLWASMRETGVFRSTDGGETWTRTTEGLTTDEQANVVDVSQFSSLAVAPDGEGNRAIFAAGFDGLFRSDDDADQWKALETLAEYIVGLGISPRYDEDSIIAVVTYIKGAYLSTDAGESWEGINQGLEHELAAGNKFAPVRRLHNVVFSPDYGNDRTLFSATWDRFLKSTDAGRSWSLIEVAPPTTEVTLRQFVLGVSPDYPEDHTLYLGTRQGDIFRSTDAGEPESWELIANVGSRVRSLVLHPDYPAEPVLYAGTVDGVLISADQGVTWRPTGPSREALLAISPGYATDRTVFAGTAEGLFVTRDAGGSWSELTGAPLPSMPSVEAVAVSPSYEDDHTLVVSVGGEGLYRSTDSGASFEALAPDLIEANRVIADFTNPTGAAIQFSPSFADDRTIFAYAAADVLRSTDAGDSWDVLEIPTAAEFLASVDPSLRDADPATSSDDGLRLSRRLLAALAFLIAVPLVGIGGYLYARRRGSATPR